MTSPAAPLLDYLLQPLRTWLDDPVVTDIAINRPSEVWVRQQGAWRREATELGLDELTDIAILAGSWRQQDVGPEEPLLSTELPNGTRLQVCLPPCVPIGAISLSFRRHRATVAPLTALADRYKTSGWNRWNEQKSVRAAKDLLPLYSQVDDDPASLETFLRAAARVRLNILLTGATGAGKTELATSCIDALDRGERIVTIEDAEELAGLPPNHVRLLYARGGIGPDYERLLEASLRMRPDRVFLQEIRGPEAATYVLQICSGHPGSITTIHGATAAEAFQRLFALAVKGAQLQEQTLTSLLSAAIDIIVPLHEDGGTHRFGSLWFCADAAERGETAAELLRL